MGRTLEVVEAVLASPDRMEELYQSYFSDDEIVRLRTSSSIKRVFHTHPEWLTHMLTGCSPKSPK